MPSVLCNCREAPAEPDNTLQAFLSDLRLTFAEAPPPGRPANDADSRGAKGFASSYAEPRPADGLGAPQLHGPPHGGDFYHPQHDDELRRMQINQQILNCGPDARELGMPGEPEMQDSRVLADRGNAMDMAKPRRTGSRRSPSPSKPSAGKYCARGQGRTRDRACGKDAQCCDV